MKTSIPHHHVQVDKGLPHSLEASEILTPGKRAEAWVQELIDIKKVIVDAKGHADKYARARALKLLGVVFEVLGIGVANRS